MANAKSTITLHFVKSTSGTHVFGCDPSIKDSASITQLYIRKSAFANRPAPPKIDVTIAYDDGQKS
jgi:hypothetical protein